MINASLHWSFSCSSFIRFSSNSLLWARLSAISINTCCCSLCTSANADNASEILFPLLQGFLRFLLVNSGSCWGRRLRRNVFYPAFACNVSILHQAYVGWLCASALFFESCGNVFIFIGEEWQWNINDTAKGFFAIIRIRQFGNLFALFRTAWHRVNDHCWFGGWFAAKNKVWFPQTTTCPPFCSITHCNYFKQPQGGCLK